MSFTMNVMEDLDYQFALYNERRITINLLPIKFSFDGDRSEAIVYDPCNY